MDRSMRRITPYRIYTADNRHACWRHSWLGAQLQAMWWGLRYPSQRTWIECWLATDIRTEAGRDIEAPFIDNLLMITGLAMFGSGCLGMLIFYLFSIL